MALIVGKGTQTPRERFAEQLRHHEVQDTTAQTYARILYGSRGLAAETPEALEGWLKRQVRPDTPKGSRASRLAAASWWLRTRGMSEADAREWIRRRVPKARRSQRNVFGVRTLERSALEDWRRAVQRMEEPYRTILLLLPETGLRIGEAVALRRTDFVEIPMDGGQPVFGVTIERAQRDGAGVGDTKGHNIRTVPLSQRAEELLESYVQRQEKSMGVQLTGYLFPGQGLTPLNPDTIRRRLRDDARPLMRHPMAQRATPHMLRHTFASQLIDRGVSLPMVQELLGHEDIKTTQIYTHPSPQALASVVRGGKGRSL